MTRAPGALRAVACLVIAALLSQAGLTTRVALAMIADAAGAPAPVRQAAAASDADACCPEHLGHAHAMAGHDHAMHHGHGDHQAAPPEQAAPGHAGHAHCLICEGGLGPMLAAAAWPIPPPGLTAVPDRAAEPAAPPSRVRPARHRPRAPPITLPTA